MIDIDGIRQILKDCDIYDKENSKNFICKCPYCGDKRGKFGSHKHSHCYVSKDDNIPVCHCWYCNGSWSLKKFLKDLTGKEQDTLIVPVNNKNYVKKNKSNLKKFVIPELNVLDFPLKSLYIKRRTFSRLDVLDVPNLIFDIKEFFNINNLKPENYLKNWQYEYEYMQDVMVGFLSHRNTILYCRSVSNEVPMKFKKIVLQKDCTFGLDYYSIDNYKKNSNVIVLSEGNFDILGCYSLNTLELRDKCRCYCSGCTFSYEQLVKSVCVDYGMYRPDVVILSDSDKNQNHYKRFIENTKPFVNTLNIYYNSCGKDFGDFPQKAVKIF